jgi:uncharacterized membrane protein
MTDIRDNQLHRHAVVADLAKAVPGPFLKRFPVFIPMGNR